MMIVEVEILLRLLNSGSNPEWHYNDDDDDDDDDDGDDDDDNDIEIIGKRRNGRMPFYLLVLSTSLHFLHVIFFVFLHLEFSIFVFLHFVSLHRFTFLQAESA